MKITAGLGRAEDYPRLVKAGADELFAGYVPLDWLERYSNITPLNRREVLMHGIQLSSLSEVQLLSSSVQEHGAPVSITFNSICYAPEQYPLIGDMICKLADLGFGDWIIADPALLLYFRQNSLPGRIHLSGEAGCFGPDALRFFLRFRPDRIIFPRKITPEEMAACISAAPNLEYEAFVLNEKCHYSGAYCSSLHCDELPHLCQVPYRPFGPDCSCAKPVPEHDGSFGASGCGLCALPRLHRAGVTHLKLVGRGGYIECIERDVRMLRRALDMGDVPADVLRSEIMDGKCSGNCYYPLPHR